MSPPSSSSDSGTARILGSASSGILELLGFHPVDTITKRLMNNPHPIILFPSSQSNLSAVIFKDSASKGLLSKYASLFPGLGFAAGYKILQRIYKFGGQPYVNDYLNTHFKSTFTRLFGDRQAKTWMHATAGRYLLIALTLQV